MAVQSFMLEAFADLFPEVTLTPEALDTSKNVDTRSMLRAISSRDRVAISVDCDITGLAVLLTRGAEDLVQKALEIDT